MLHAIVPLESTPSSVPVLEALQEDAAAGDLPGRQRYVFDPGKAEVTLLRAAEPAARMPAPTGRLALTQAEAPRLPRTSRVVAAVASAVVSMSLVSGIATGMAFLDDAPVALATSSASA